MDYTEAIRLALSGEQSGFKFLYESTYQKKYFLALQYMKNEAAAEDVMQEAYIKAFLKLDTLEKPEKFPGWLGVIVANMAKNALKKNNPMLFSDITVNDEQEVFEYQIEDDNIDHMPETAYTREETRQLTHELIDSLSEEQRMCILMFHIEGLSIKEIASELDCSENTVKSRLKYGRDNIKAKGEELQKKGYQLYGLAPLPLLFYLLQKEAEYMEADGSLTAAGARIAERVIPSGVQDGAGTSNGIKKAAGSSIKAAKSGFLHTMAGKATIAVVGLCLAGGVVAYGVSQLNTKETAAGPEVTEENAVESEAAKEDAVESEAAKEDAAESEAAKEDAAESEAAEEEKKDKETPGTTVKEVQDEEYETLIAGNLTKEELQFVLAYGPQEIPKQGFQSRDYFDILNSLCEASGSNTAGPVIEDYGPDADWRGQYSVTDVNRMFRSFTDFQLSEGDSTLFEYNIQVQGNAVVFAGASLSRISNAVITSANYTEEKMEVYYTYDTITADMEMMGEPEEVENRKAVLKPNADGLYQIVKIKVIEGSEAEKPEAQKAEAAEPKAEETPEFPAGLYFNADTSGTAYRGSLTVDSAGVVTYTEWSSGTWEGIELKYQMSVDNTATVPDGVTAYSLQFIEGNEFQLTETEREVTRYLESWDDWELFYDANQKTLQDTDGFTWVLEE